MCSQTEQAASPASVGRTDLASFAVSDPPSQLPAALPTTQPPSQLPTAPPTTQPPLQLHVPAPPTTQTAVIPDEVRGVWPSCDLSPTVSHSPATAPTQTPPTPPPSFAQPLTLSPLPPSPGPTPLPSTSLVTQPDDSIVQEAAALLASLSDTLLSPPRPVMVQASMDQQQAFLPGLLEVSSSQWLGGVL